jgi:RNA ligase
MIKMNIDLNELRGRKEFINEKISDSGNLIIWNYNAKCQWERAWDKYTTMSRGLITDTEGEIIARPFPKFFNLNESEITSLKNLPTEIPLISEKLDGSLGIQYQEHNKIKIATRGSFGSEQAIWATKWIQDRYSIENFKEGYTYLYEIIYPENRIVVNYGNRKELVLLAVIETKSGKELDYRNIAVELKINWARHYNVSSIHQIIDLLPDLNSEEEGFVARYNNGLRVKFKGDEYKRLHKLLTQFSTISIWENLKAGTDFIEIFDRVPREFKDWVESEIDHLKASYDNIYYQALEALEEISGLKERKEQALILQQRWSSVLSIVFAMIDDKFKEEMIWKRLKPKFNLPFKDERM